MENCFLTSEMVSFIAEKRLTLGVKTNIIELISKSSLHICMSIKIKMQKKMFRQSASVKSSQYSC